jgi:hypothetical protein
MLLYVINIFIGMVMYKIFLISFFTMLLNVQPLFSQNNNLNLSVDTAFKSRNTLGLYNNLRTQSKRYINFNLEYSEKNISSQLSLNFNDNKKLNYDRSYVNYKKGIANFSVGKIDRIWSFSRKSSLILSSNSRPLEAISIKLENKFNTRLLSSAANWSIEMINGSTKNSFYGNNNSMLSGTRVVIRPTKQLNFEFLQTGQWGDQNDKLYSQNIDALLFGNTNEGVNSHLNKMAGFGLSYSIPLRKSIYRFYSQAIGEDEAGNMPSCYAWMLGLELSAPEVKYPTTITIEAIDTRVKTSTHGNCGPNTMYQNNVYNYITTDTVLGVPIDTESTSVELFGQSQVNENVSIDYSTKFLSINDKDFLEHRLSSKRSLGTITSLGINWKKGSLNLGGSIAYQNLILDKTNISNGTIFSLFTSVKF